MVVAALRMAFVALVGAAVPAVRAPGVVAVASFEAFSFEAAIFSFAWSARRSALFLNWSMRPMTSPPKGTFGA